MSKSAMQRIRDLESQLKNLTSVSRAIAYIDIESKQELEETASEFKCHLYKPFEQPLFNYFFFDLKVSNNITITVRSVQRYKEKPSFVEL